MSEQQEPVELYMEDIDAMNTIKPNITSTHTIEDFGFGYLPQSEVIEIYKDGRVFSHFIERWLPTKFPLVHIKGCKSYDHIHLNDENIKYDQKTFTSNGCRFMPSNMIGQGRTLNKEVFEEKARKLIYIIVSNVNFPEIKVKFVRGVDLLVDFPEGKIPLKDFEKFFN